MVVFALTKFFMSAHWDIKDCIRKIHPLWFILSFASKPPLPRVGIFMLLSFFPLVSSFNNPFGNLILIPLVSLIALLLLLSPLFLFPTRHRGSFPWVLWAQTQRGIWQWFPGSCTLCSVWCHVQPSGCTWPAGWPLTALMREMSGELLLGLFQVSRNSFQMCFMQELWEGSEGLAKVLVVED